MRKRFREERRIYVHEQDIIRSWRISVERYVQRFLACVEDYVDETTLSREFLGDKLRQRAATEIVFQLVYNGMHIHSKFDWEKFDIPRLLEAVVKHYVPKYARRDTPSDVDCEMSGVLDTLIETLAADIEDYLIEEEMTGLYYEPTITVVYGNQFLIDVYDWRAYQWMLHQKERDAQEREENDERSPFYVGG